MSEEIKIDRSPRSAAYPLEEAIIQAKKIYDNAGKSSIKRDLAFKAMGYAGSSGASLSALATLIQYGLIDKNDSDVSVSNLAIRIFHPIDGDKDAAVKEAALTPPLFKTIFETHNKLAEGLLANHLVHQGFNPDRAKKVAAVYKANCVFAKLDNSDSLEHKSDTDKEDLKGNSDKTKVTPPLPPKIELPLTSERPVLATYTIPLGANQATLVFTGQRLTEDDFDALTDFVAFSKKQFVRASKSDVQPTAKEEPTS